jgi:hypothetical protein
MARQTVSPDYFAERYPELRALFRACEDRKAVLALAKRITRQLMGDEPQEVPMCFGALEAYKREALDYHYAPKSVLAISGAEARVRMADRYLSRSNRVGRLR